MVYDVVFGRLELIVFLPQRAGLRLQPLDLLQGALQVHVADVVAGGLERDAWLNLSQERSVKYRVITDQSDFPLGCVDIKTKVAFSFMDLLLKRSL